jgi:UDP-N-acetylglucosamine 2-epimerase (non-hydrolysing)
MKILSIFGTRPEAIKMAPVLRALERRRETVESVVCVTAQHRQMLDQVLTLFGIKPDIDLNLMQANQGVGDFAAQALAAVNGVLDTVKPDALIVQGDTTTAVAAGIAGFYRGVAVAHVEAGLRTNDPMSPFPEEINRRMLDVVSKYRFAPTKSSARALRAEGYPAKSIHITGNTVVDALQFILKTPGVRPAVPTGGKLIVVTSHRREHFGEPLQRICDAILEIVKRHPEAHVVYPVHLNPNVRGPVHQRLGGHEQITLLEPMSYDGFVRLMAEASLIITDSGGIQEEAPALGVPVVIIREKTERAEAVRAGAARLAGTSVKGIVSAAHRELVGRRRRVPRSLFGDGRAAERIVRILIAGEGAAAKARARRRAG